MKIIYVYETFLYYCCLLLVTRYLLNCIPRQIYLLNSFLTFIPLIIFALSNNANIFTPAYIIFLFLQFLLIKISFVKAKIQYVFFFYILLYCSITLITSLFAAIFPLYWPYAETLIITIATITCAVLCLTKARISIHQIFEWTPHYILIISGLLLITATLISTLISGLQHSTFPNVWNTWIQMFTTFLLVIICIIVPIIFIISISNTRLKTLTANYEQQIRAQAEHYKNLADANYEVRRFRHDFKNIRIAIEKLLAQGEYDEALALIRQCSDTLENPGGFHPIFDTGNGIADALLTDKQEKAAQRNTQIVFQGAIPPVSLSPTDLCVILGNSLDNALDACQKLQNGDNKTISVDCKCCGGFLFLSITNPIAEKVTIRDNHIATTKENKTLHGFGLYSLHSIVKKYDGNIQLTSTEETFTISIDLCLMERVS